jgi:hypothetical protein
VVEKPTAAFVLSLIGGILYLLIGFAVAVLVGFLGLLASFAIPIAGFAIAIIGGIGLVSGILMIVGASMMNSSDVGRVRTGSVLVLIFLLVGALFTFGGAVIGFLLALIGSILGLTWHPSAPTPQPAPTTT